MGTHVVVGYDGSAEAVAAVRWAARLAARLGLPLQVVHVWGLAGQLDVPPLSTASAYVREGAQEVTDEGRTVAQETAPGLEVTAVLVDGPPAQALVDRAAGATYLVVGRQGTGRLSGILMGSVALGAVQHAGCPVVVVPRTQLEPVTTGRVVVGVDGSPASLGAVVAAAEYAVTAGARLVVVSAWRSPVHGRSLASWLREHPEVDPDDLARDTARRAQEPALELLAEQFAELEVDAVVEQGQAAHVLARHAERADLLVVGTRGRGGIAGLVLGSVSQWLVARAACPVLVSRAGIHP